MAGFSFCRPPRIETAFLRNQIQRSELPDRGVVSRRESLPMMWNLVTNGISMEWWRLMVGVGLMACILILHDVRFQPRTGATLTVAALFLVVCWIVVARELTA